MNAVQDKMCQPESRHGSLTWIYSDNYHVDYKASIKWRHKWIIQYPGFVFELHIMDKTANEQENVNLKYVIIVIFVDTKSSWNEKIQYMMSNE